MADPDTPQQDPGGDYNPGQQAYDEGIGSGTPKSSKPKKDGDDTAAAREAEEKGDWKDKFSNGPGAARSGKGISKANFRAVLKKRGPLAAILTLVFGGGIGAGVFFGPSLLLVQIQESFLTHFDTQNTSLTIRTNRILTNKLTDDTTQGSCNIVKIACRFSRPSNKLLKNLERNGVLAYDKNGDIISRKDGLFQPDRPVKYTFRGEDISAKDFSRTLRTNAEFRAAFHRAYNPRFVGFTDKVFRGISKRFGFDVSNKDAKSGEKPTAERLNSASKGANAVAGEAAEGAEGIIQKLLSTKAGEIVGKIAKGGKGDAFGLVAASVCTIADIPKLIVTTVRAYQLVQVVNYSMQFLIAGSALKAGEITSEQATALGALLTTAVANKTAMDSFGMKYAMFGDTSSSSTSWKKFIPGGSIFSTPFGATSRILSSGPKQAICDFATNPATGAAINVGLAAAGPESLGISLVVATVNIAAGFVVAEVVEKVGVPLIVEAMKGVDVQPLLGFFLGDLTQNLEGTDVGDAMVSGASNMMGQTANAGGNMPLSVEQAVAYNQKTKEVNIAYAEEDRATHSPLDPTNPNTMVGSIVGKIAPYLASMNSVAGTLKSLASIPSGSLASLINNSTASAADESEQYKLCDDPSVTDDGTAAGPFCNIAYGIPTEYLNMDPQDIVDTLVSSNDVNADTGDPIEKDEPGLYQWMSTCTDGATDQLKNCRIVDDKTAMYSVYMIDHRIQESMDEEDDGSTSSTATDDESDTTTTNENAETVDPNTPTTTTPSGGSYSNKPQVLFNNIGGLESLASTLSTQFVSTPTLNAPLAAIPAVSSVNYQAKGYLSVGWYWGIA